MKRRLSTIILVAAVALAPLALTSCVSNQNASVTKKKAKYKRVGGSRINRVLLSAGTKRNTRVVVDIADQKAFLLVDGKIAAASPISTAKPGKRTPRGTFSISQKVRTGKISTIYNVEMPYWMRLSGTPFGMHAGYLPGYPASAGCVRMPSSMARLFFDHTHYGTRVSIYSSWSGG